MIFDFKKHKRCVTPVDLKTKPIVTLTSL